MIRRLAYSLFLVTSFSATAQYEMEQWTELGVKGKLTDKLGLNASFTTRISDIGVRTFFPQVGLNYKVTDWFKPSLEYRFIVDKNDAGNYHASSRINANLSFSGEVKRFELSLRLRYQYAFENNAVQRAYNPDFDQAIRLKGDVVYNIDNNPISPTLGTELFYDPMLSETGPELYKLRSFIGFKVNLKGPHEIGVKYIFENSFDYPQKFKHILDLGYTYEF